MERFIKRSAPPDELTDEQRQEWLLEHASEQFAKIGKTDDQRKKLRLTADVGAALEDDAGGSTFLSSIFLFAPPLSLPVPLLGPLLVILCDTGRPPGRGEGGGGGESWMCGTAYDAQPVVSSRSLPRTHVCAHGRCRIQHAGTGQRPFRQPADPGCSGRRDGDHGHRNHRACW